MEYVSADNAETLGEATAWKREILLSCAVLIGGTRLIDNVVVTFAEAEDLAGI